MNGLKRSGEAIRLLAGGDCVPRDGNYRLLSPVEGEAMLQQLPEAWRIEDQNTGKCLQRVYSCSEYTEAAAFTQQVATLAEQVNHHPRLVLEWRQLTVEISTHAVGGLAIGDFVFAARTELLGEQLGLTNEPG